MSPKIDSSRIGSATAAWSRDVRPNAAGADGGVTYSRRSFYYDREFSDSIVVARSTNGDDGSRLLTSYASDFSYEPRRRYPTRLLKKDEDNDRDEEERKANEFMRGRVLQSSQGIVVPKDYSGATRYGLESSPPQVAPPSPSSFSTRSSVIASSTRVDEDEEEEEFGRGLKIAGIDAKTIATVAAEIVVLGLKGYQHYQRFQPLRENRANGGSSDVDDGEQSGSGFDLDPYYLEAGPPRRHPQRLSPSRHSPARKFSRRRVDASEEAQEHTSDCADGATSSSLLPPLSAAQRVCYYLIGAVLFGIVASFVVAVWWARSQGDTSAGFTIGGYVIAVDALIVAIGGLVHIPGCRCWKA
ncbi:hypothetical protein F5B22DRAFT_563206 [Xylaria bambusicola]|uniref:uncharacterized protein n=1 Tax=Xylaria bambusicola TaxID=326684 RepID=UPI002007226A|nr:uncharacterized protein F5B22DRAFT_563206 [Xylaria bambusicola]KAI0503154.1 hypothetical protein F5B22DRAFT_563206 [Xylaria bambusicola]